MSIVRDPCGMERIKGTDERCCKSHCIMVSGHLMEGAPLFHCAITHSSRKNFLRNALCPSPTCLSAHTSFADTYGFDAHHSAHLVSNTLPSSRSTFRSIYNYSDLPRIVSITSVLVQPPIIHTSSARIAPFGPGWAWHDEQSNTGSDITLHKCIQEGLYTIHESRIMDGQTQRHPIRAPH